MIARILASNAGTTFVIMLALLVLVYVGVLCAAWTTHQPPRRPRSLHWRARNKNDSAYLKTNRPRILK